MRRPGFGSIQGRWPDNLLSPRTTKSAHEIGDEANEQNQAKPAAAYDGPTEVKPTAPKHEKQDNNEQ